MRRGEHRSRESLRRRFWKSLLGVALRRASARLCSEPPSSACTLVSPARFPACSLVQVWAWHHLLPLAGGSFGLRPLLPSACLAGLHTAPLDASLPYAAVLGFPCLRPSLRSTLRHWPVLWLSHLLPHLSLLPPPSSLGIPLNIAEAIGFGMENAKEKAVQAARRQRVSHPAPAPLQPFKASKLK